MPKTHFYPTSTGWKFEPNHQSLALRQMRARYNWTIPSSTGEQEICSDSNGLFYQMGKSRGLGKYQGRGHEEIRMEKHNYEIWGSLGSGIQQWALV